MGRAPCCSKIGLHRGPWTTKEDTLLTNYIHLHGEGNWRSMPNNAGLLRCGKSCRLRWMNYLRPDIKRGNITPDEDELIIKMHSLLGNRWSLIAGRLPGRTDNEIKNYWNTHLSKKLIHQGTDPNTHKKLSNPTEQKERKKKGRKITSNNGNKRERKGPKLPIQEPEKLKAHNPKPTRIKSISAFALSRNSSFEWTGSSTSTGCGSSSLGDQDKRLFTWANVMENNDDHDHDRGSFLIGSIGRDCDFVQGSNRGFQSYMGDSDNHTFEKLFDEYYQLLKAEEKDQTQLDSFAESLFI